VIDGEGIGGESAHPHDKVVGASMTSDPSLGGLDPTVELLQIVVRARQAGDVVAMVEMVPKVVENGLDVLDRRV